MSSPLNQIQRLEVIRSSPEIAIDALVPDINLPDAEFRAACTVALTNLDQAVEITHWIRGAICYRYLKKFPGAKGVAQLADELQVDGSYCRRYARIYERHFITHPHMRYRVPFYCYQMLLRYNPADAQTLFEGLEDLYVTADRMNRPIAQEFIRQNSPTPHKHQSRSYTVAIKQIVTYPAFYGAKFARYLKAVPVRRREKFMAAFLTAMLEYGYEASLEKALARARQAQPQPQREETEPHPGQA